MSSNVERIHNYYDKVFEKQDLQELEALVDKELAALRVPRALLMGDLVNFHTDISFKEPTPDK